MTSVMDQKLSHTFKFTLTTVEGLLQTLAEAKVFIVGTHKDKLDSETKISIIDQQLQEAIKSTAHYKDLVEFASAKQLIFILLIIFLIMNQVSMTFVHLLKEL